MTALRSSAVIVCLCAIACSIIGLIAPLGRMKKTVNLILGVFLICSMIIPIIGLFDSLSYDFELNESEMLLDDSYENSYDAMILENTADNLVYAANDLLLSEDIQAENIEIGIKKSDNNSIYISSINIYISKDDEDKAEQIKKIIGSNMSKEPVIIISEEEN